MAGFFLRGLTVVVILLRKRIVIWGSLVGWLIAFIVAIKGEVFKICSSSLVRIVQVAGGISFAFQSEFLFHVVQQGACKFPMLRQGIIVHGKGRMMFVFVPISLVTRKRGGFVVARSEFKLSQGGWRHDKLGRVPHGLVIAS
jgi:hypothetical protein